MAAPVVPGVPEARVKPLGIPDVSASPDAFGAAQARAMQGVGQQLQGVGGKLLDLQADQNAVFNQNTVLDAANKARDDLRPVLWDPEKGLMNQRGANAMGVEGTYEQKQKEIYDKYSSQITDPKAKQDFERGWAKITASDKDTLAQLSAREQITYGDDVTKASIVGATNDFIDANGDPKREALALNTGKAAILVNRQGEPTAALQNKLDVFESGARKAVISRLVEQGKPDEAIDYYNQNRDKIRGVDHIDVERSLDKPLQMRRENTRYQNIMGTSTASGRLMNSVIQIESGGDANAESNKGAAGVAQMMPGTAREVATQMGDPSFATMSDADVKANLKADPARAARMGKFYLDTQLKKYKGDPEAALIAYNAGPGVADKWLDKNRDNSILPNETRAYVGKVMSHYAGAEETTVQTAGGSKYTTVGADAFLATRLPVGKPITAVTGMAAPLKTGLAAMFNDAPPAFAKDLGIYSGYRDANYQAGIISKNINRYVAGSKAEWDADVKSMGAEAAGAKWRPRLQAAGMTGTYGMPGGSNHQHGTAADLSYKGQSLAHAPKEVVDWLHSNAGKYGLKFPLANENWHVEAATTRGGKPGPYEYSGSGFQADTSYPVTPATVQSLGGRMQIRTTNDQPRDLDDMLSQVDATSTGDATADARMKARLTADWNRQQKQNQADLKAIASDAMKEVLSGKSYTELDPAVVSQLDGPTLDRLQKTEDQVAKRGEPKTDYSAYQKLSRMRDDDFKDVDIVGDYGDRLDRGDLKKFQDKQAALLGQDDKARTEVAGLRSRSDIVNRSLQVMGIEPNKSTSQATTASLFEKKLDERIAAETQATGKPLKGDEIQRLADQLMITDRSWFGGKHLFETPGSRVKDFKAASSVSDIPEDVVATVSKNYAQMNGEPLDFEKAGVKTYNQAVQAFATGTAPFPGTDDEEGAAFALGLGKKLGRTASDAELSKYWNVYLSKLLEPSTPAPAPARPAGGQAPVSQFPSGYQR